MLQCKVSGDVAQHWWYIQYNTSGKLSKTVHPDYFGEKSSSLRPRKSMIAGRHFTPIRMANHPLHPFSLSSGYYYCFYSLLTGLADAPPPNHCFTKTVYTQTIENKCHVDCYILGTNTDHIGRIQESYQSTNHLVIEVNYHRYLLIFIYNIISNHPSGPISYSGPILYSLILYISMTSGNSSSYQEVRHSLHSLDLSHNSDPNVPHATKNRKILNHYPIGRANKCDHSHKKRKDSLKTRAVHVKICMLCWNLTSGPKHQGSF